MEAITKAIFEHNVDTVVRLLSIYTINYEEN